MTEIPGLESRSFELEIITPMFLGGADGVTPELRVPPFKGCMRYWWRAAVAETDIKSLYGKEAELFGSSAEGAGKSPLILKIKLKDALETDEYRPLPHSDQKKFKAPGLKPGQKFELYLQARKNLGLYSNILELSLLLGGIGKRSRRGFGSMGIKGTDFSTRSEVIDYIYQRLSSIAGDKKYEKRAHDEREEIIRSRVNHDNNSDAYPYIKEICIGKAENHFDPLLRKIGKASHDHSNLALGYAGKLRINEKKEPFRMASPVYVSVVKIRGRYAPVITTLLSKFPYPERFYDIGKQDSFKRAL